ncbi:MAG: glutathione S-transferase N-terminal domain-containing protein [Verrucomicrobiota bacterium]
MITFYRNKNCNDCAVIEERLQELSLAHKTVTVVGQENDAQAEQRGGTMPKLDDNGKVVTGHNPIAEHIGKLQSFKEQWEKFQSDACYCDE